MSTLFEEVFAINDGVGGDDIRCVLSPIESRLPQVLCDVKVRVVVFKGRIHQVLEMREVLSDELQLLILMGQRSEEMMENIAKDLFLMRFNIVTLISVTICTCAIFLGLVTSSCESSTICLSVFYRLLAPSHLDHRDTSYFVFWMVCSVYYSRVSQAAVGCVCSDGKEMLTKLT